jgi:hypothetical protein
MTRPPPRAATHQHVHSPGKTTFLNFMLARLISAHQVVVLYDSSDTHLFYRGQAYYRPGGSDFRYLPRRPEAGYYPIWALIDVGSQENGPPFTDRSNIWPIHTTSPSPVRWTAWQKHWNAALWGMPLWSVEELIEGYVLFSLSAIEPGHAVR